MGVEVKSGGDGVIKEVKSELALQLERCCCDLKNGQQEIGNQVSYREHC